MFFLVDKEGPKAHKVSYTLQLNVAVETQSKISEIRSPSHKIDSKLNGNQATVALATKETELNSDFVLYVKVVISVAICTN